MSDLLYLDTARLGQISPNARRALYDITEFNADFGASVFFNDLLYGGVQSLPDPLQQQFRGLCIWNGLDAFRNQISQFVSLDFPDCLLSSRTKELVRFSSMLMFSRCRRVLTSDLTWPPYQTYLAEEARRRNAGLFVVSVENSILSGKATRESVAERIAKEYRRLNCDGLFLPAVSHFGINLPIETIARNLRATDGLRFFVLDASQAAGQIRLESLVKAADFAFFGTHKWLRSLTPLGIGTLGRHESRAFILDSGKRWLHKGLVQDPLWQFLDDERELVFGETVNLTPIFCAAGAIHDAGGDTACLHNHWGDVASSFHNGWKKLPIAECLQSKIMMLQREMKCWDKQSLRRAFAKQGVSVTTYADGKCRLSIPPSGLCKNSIEILNSAISSI